MSRAECSGNTSFESYIPTTNQVQWSMSRKFARWRCSYQRYLNVSGVLKIRYRPRLIRKHFDILSRAPSTDIILNCNIWHIYETSPGSRRGHNGQSPLLGGNVPSHRCPCCHTPGPILTEREPANSIISFLFWGEALQSMQKHDRSCGGRKGPQSAMEKGPFAAKSWVSGHSERRHPNSEICERY
jgi:hypothetical protein